MEVLFVLFFLSLNFITGGEQRCCRERLSSCRGGREGGGKKGEQQGRNARTQESECFSRLFSVVPPDVTLNVRDISRGGRGSAAGTATTKPATPSPSQTQTPTAPINPRRRKRLKTRTMRKRRVKVGRCAGLLFFWCPFMAIIFRNSALVSNF